MEDIREEKLNSNIISEGQYHRITYTINKIKKGSLGKAKIQDITAKQIQDFLDSISDLSDSYIKKIFEQFVQAYDRAEIKKYISYNPMKEIIKPKSKNEAQKVEALTVEEQRRLVQYLINADIRNEPYKNIFLI